MLCLLGYLCSNVADYLLKIMNPTINYSNGVISRLPVSLDVSENLKKLVKENNLSQLSKWIEDNLMGGMDAETYFSFAALSIIYGLISLFGTVEFKRLGAVLDEPSQTSGLK